MTIVENGYVRLKKYYISNMRILLIGCGLCTAGSSKYVQILIIQVGHSGAERRGLGPHGEEDENRGRFRNSCRYRIIYL